MTTILALSAKQPVGARIGSDSERVKRAVKKLKAASKTKRERLVADLKSAVEAIDRIAKDEIDFLQTVFDTESSSADAEALVEFEEIDDIVIFNYNGDDK
jgi:hypothetical protein